MAKTSTKTHKTSTGTKKETDEERHISKVFKKLQDLGKVKDRFVIPSEPDEEAVDIGQSEFKRESERIVKRDEKTLKLINLAVKHVEVYDSKETALEIMNKAYAFCPSVFNKRKISFASQSLKAAIKAEKWAKSRKRRRHVDEHTIKKNVTSFHEKVSEAVISIQVEIEKRTHQLFTRVKEQYISELPLSLPDSKSYVVKKAHTIVYCVNTPVAPPLVKVTHLEGKLFLLENVKVIGVNSTKNKNSMKKASEVAYKDNNILYENKLVRPSENIDWYLVANFETKITFASFADSMHLSDDSSGGALSYEDYIKGKEAERKIDLKIKNQRLAALRKQFYEDNITVTDDTKQLKIELDNLDHERKQLQDHLASITSTSDTDKGLSLSTFKWLERSMSLYRDNLITKEGMDYTTANLNMIKQRIEARSCYFSIMEVTGKIRAIKRQIAFFEKELENRKEKYAANLGMVNMNKFVSNDLD